MATATLAGITTTFPAATDLTPRTLSGSGPSQRRLSPLAVVPWTTIEAITHTIVVHTIVVVSLALSTPAPTATAM